MKTSPLNEAADGNGMNSFPIGQCLSPLPGESPTAHTKLKRKAPETPEGREKKREADRAYRRRCKEEKMKTVQNLFVLTEENKKLKRENDYFKGESEVKQQKMVQSRKDEMITLLPNELDQLKAQRQSQHVVVEVLSQQVLAQTLQRQKDEMKKLEKEFVELKGQLHKQNTVLEVLPKLLGGSNEDLHRENAQLKLDIDILTRQINNPESLNAIQLRAKIARMENEKHSLEVIIDALCEKINNDKHQLGPQN